MFSLFNFKMGKYEHLKVARAVAMAERKYRHPQVNLRLPEELKERIAEIAERNKRSSNAEMVAAIENWVKRDTLYNYKSEISFINVNDGSHIDDPTVSVNLTKGELNRMIGDAAEEAAYAVVDKIHEKYDVSPKNKKPSE
ncbi:MULTISPECIES: Arc family DNA-binding protein [unclassified Erwinia]|uniref:Arc family DNA-binding protein n=1 Tax=unclassified Erwinia TaxID=2622719 RepID=UPI00315E01DA